MLPHRAWRTPRPRPAHRAALTLSLSQRERDAGEAARFDTNSVEAFRAALAGAAPAGSTPPDDPRTGPRPVIVSPRSPAQGRAAARARPPDRTAAPPATGRASSRRRRPGRAPARP